MCIPAPQLLMLSTMTTVAGSMAMGSSASRSATTGALREVEQMQRDKELADVQAQTAIGQTLINSPITSSSRVCIPLL